MPEKPPKWLKFGRNFLAHFIGKIELSACVFRRMEKAFGFDKEFVVIEYNGLHSAHTFTFDERLKQELKKTREKCAAVQCAYIEHIHTNAKYTIIFV